METGTNTIRGEITKERILRIAADMIHRNGVNASSVDDILAASKTGKSQFYYYFENKDQLVREVLQYQVKRTSAEQTELLKHLDTWKGIQNWLDYFVARFKKYECVGCPIGGLSSEMAVNHPELRKDLVTVFEKVQANLEQGLAKMKSDGRLKRKADPKRLAEYAWGVMQGGFLMAKTHQDVAPLKRILDQLMSHLKSFAK